MRRMTTIFDLTTYDSPPGSPASLVEIWRSHDGLSLRQRNPPSRPSWPQDGDSIHYVQPGSSSGNTTTLYVRAPMHWKEINEVQGEWNEVAAVDGRNLSKAAGSDRGDHRRVRGRERIDGGVSLTI